MPLASIGHRSRTQALSKYQDLWDMLDEIDAQTWVLEPENPTRNITLRRIAVGMPLCWEPCFRASLQQMPFLHPVIAFSMLFV